MATVSGVWIFNDTLTFSTTGTFSVQATTNGVGITKIQVTTNSLNYYWTGGSSSTAYGRGNWANQAYKTVDFGTTEQTVADNFYTWLTSNAVQQSGDPSKPETDTLYTVKGSSLTAIADGFRASRGTTQEYTLDEMAVLAAEEVGGGGGDIDALIEGSFTEITSNAESVRGYAFRECTKLTTANFPLVTSIGNYAFQNCSALTSVNFPVAMIINKYAFQDCSALTTANFPVATSVGEYTFFSCTALTTADFPAVTRVGSNAFNRCTALTTADFPAATSIASYAFQNCYTLTALILRRETMCTLSNTNAFNSCYHILGTVNSAYNPDGLKDGYIYVPSALVDSYKAATNWSTYATQFRALEDYTVDGTITGELDPEKI